MTSNNRLYFGSEYAYLPLMVEHGPFFTNFLKIIKDTLDRSLAHNPRLSVLRFDLRLPQHWEYHNEYIGNTFITNFFRNLNERLETSYQRSLRHTRHTYHHHGMRYVWVRERHRSQNYHYHVALFVNRDKYRGLGDINHVYQSIANQRSTPDTLLGHIYAAWTEVLGLDLNDTSGLIHIPANHSYPININATGENGQISALEQISAAFHRLSYMAKLATKEQDGYRNIGYSNK